MFENANTFPNLVAAGGLSGLDSCYRVGYWAWEVDEFPACDAAAADLVDEVWTLSEHSARAIARAVDAPIFVVPPPIRPDAFPFEVSGDSSSHPFRVLVSFDALSIPGRKNPIGAIAAYQQAFSPDDGAELIIKLVNAKHADVLAGDLEAAIADRPDISVHDGYLDRLEYAALVASSDVFLSLHRAEGFGFTMAEAMAAGKPVVATGYSGNLEFMTRENSILIDYELVPVGPGHDPYPPTARWANPDLASAAQALRRLKNDPSLARGLGERAKADIASLHAPRSRAALVERRVREAADRRQTRTPDAGSVGPVAPPPTGAPRPFVWRAARRCVREARRYQARRRDARAARARRRSRSRARRAADALLEADVPFE